MQLAASEHGTQDRASRLPESAAPGRVIRRAERDAPIAFGASRVREAMFPHISFKMKGFERLQTDANSSL